jgi:hypothetical protein
MRRTHGFDKNNFKKIKDDLNFWLKLRYFELHNLNPDPDPGS